MYCLHCGDCCLRMSPISSPNPCPNLTQDGTFYFCGTYESRPSECVNHRFPSLFCPIGMDILGLSYPRDTEKIRIRLDEGYTKIQML